MKCSILGALILTGFINSATADETKSSFQRAESQREPTRTTITGTILSMSGYNLAIETPAGNRIDFELGSDSVLSGGIARGDDVVVSYRPAETGMSHVIEVVRNRPASDQAITTAAAAAPAAAKAPSTVIREATATGGKSPAVTTSHRGAALVGVLALGAMVAFGLLLRSRS